MKLNPLPHFLNLLILAISINSSFATETRYLDPPKLGPENIGKKVIGYRPMRRGSPNFSVERFGDKIVANNYGHGGSGWTLAPGSSKYVVNQLIKELSGRSSDHLKNEAITVIGAGVIGLFSALELVENGFSNITVVAENYDDLTSHVAGALFAPASMSNSADHQALIDSITVESLRFYRSIVSGSHSDFSLGVRALPVYFSSREGSPLQSFVGNGIDPAKDVIVDFGTGKTMQMVVYDDGIYIDTPIFMKALHDFLEDKVKFETKKIENFSDVSSSIIVNCSGLGAAALTGDDRLVSVQGHLVMLKKQKPADMRYMMVASTGTGETKSGFKVNRDHYLFPKVLPESGENDIGVIGGSFIEGADSTTPNEEEFDILIQNAKDFYGIK